MCGRMLRPPLAPPSDVPMPDEPNVDPHFYDNMMYEELHASRHPRCCAGRDARSIRITRELATNDIERKRARGDTEVEPSAAKQRSPSAASQCAFAEDKEALKQHGQWRDPALEESWGALPRPPVDAVDHLGMDGRDPVDHLALRRPPFRNGRRTSAEKRWAWSPRRRMSRHARRWSVLLENLNRQPGWNSTCPPSCRIAHRKKNSGLASGVSLEGYR